MINRRKNERGLQTPTTMLFFKSIMNNLVNQFLVTRQPQNYFRYRSDSRAHKPTGKSIGVNINIADIIFIKTPIHSKIKLMINKVIIGLLLMSALVKVCEIFF